MKKKMTYKGSGVDYDSMDPFKKAAQLAARETSLNLKPFGFSEVEMSRGESVYLIETADSYLAHVEEGLGTKNLVAESLYLKTGQSFFRKISQDTVAMIVNDMITLGALPVSVAMHLAVGESLWFQDEKRYQDLLRGWKIACDLAGCVWAGGETPTLKDIVMPGTMLLSGSAVGIITPKERLINCRIQDGDVIVFLESSGIHANGLTLARKIAHKLHNHPGGWPQLYCTEISDGRTYGEALLDPTIIYVPFIKYCLDVGIDLHYTVNITGHGWRKLMRAPEPFVYIIETVMEPLPIFKYIQEQGPVDDKEAYANFNMGAGFALYVPEKEVERVIMAGQKMNIFTWGAGHIEKRGEEKKVVIEPLNIEYQGKSLDIR